MAVCDKGCRAWANVVLDVLQIQCEAKTLEEDEDWYLNGDPW